LSRHRLWIIFALIVILGFVIRLHGYRTVPPHSWTADEFAYAWCGMSLIQQGVPTAWSWLDVYGDRPVTRVGSRHYRMVTPWLDHPPLFGLLVGAAALLSGERDYFDCTLGAIRLPSLLLGVLSLALVFLLSRELFGETAAVLAALVFATDPNLVFLSRLAVSENLIVFLLLAALWLFLRHCRAGGRKYLYLAALCAGLASLAKVTGFFVVILLVLLLLQQRKRREAVEALVIGLVLFAFYFIYGSLYDFRLFWALLLEHGGRFKDFTFQQQLLFHREMRFFDPWFLFGWLVLIPVVRDLQNRTRQMVLFLPLLVYLVSLLGAGAQGHFFAWYTLPFYPFIAMALGLFFARLLEAPDFTGAALAIVFIVLWCLTTVFADPNWSIIAHYLDTGLTRHLILLLAILAIVPYYYLHGQNPARRTALAARRTTLALLAFCFLANAFIVHGFPAVFAR
jgi:4-amino-4-deoxy-L-arabinose transferase-like glycosyltransferase